MPLIDRTGQMFGRLTVLSYAGESKWLCRCDCGNTKAIHQTSLRKGNVKSCGCLRREVTKARATTHGLSKAPEYIVWRGIKQRCFDPNCHIYEYYGGRGITLDSRWMDFAAFYRDMAPRPSPRHWIERIDNDGSYSPENCRWALPVEQIKNTRRTVRMFGLVGGKAIAEYLGITERALYHRRSRGQI